MALRTVELVDIATTGDTPRMGALDVDPRPLGPEGAALLTGDDLRAALTGATASLKWAAKELESPCFLYGTRTLALPEWRRRAFCRPRASDRPAARPHPTAGAPAVGARSVLVAYNCGASQP